MKVTITPQEDGKYGVYVKRTRAKENPSRAALNVPAEKLEETVEQLVKEMRGEVSLS